MNKDRHIHVKIGEVKIGGPGETLTAIVGSCIGLGFLNSEVGQFGLAHCLLSNSNTSSTKIGGRYVDQAIRSMFTLMELSSKDLVGIQAIIIGGANMTMPIGTDPSKLVGEVNAKFAYSELRRIGVRNIYQEVGGTQGRHVTIDCSTGQFNTLAIPRLRDR